MLNFYNAAILQESLVLKQIFGVLKLVKELAILLVYFLPPYYQPLS